MQTPPGKRKKRKSAQIATMCSFVGSDLWNGLDRPFFTILSDIPGYSMYPVDDVNICTLRKFEVRRKNWRSKIVYYVDYQNPCSMLTALYVPFPVALDLKFVSLFTKNYNRRTKDDIIARLKPPFVDVKDAMRFPVAEKNLHEIIEECRNVPSEQRMHFPSTKTFDHDFSSLCNFEPCGATYVRIEMMYPCVTLNDYDELHICLGTGIIEFDVFVEEWFVVGKDIPKIPRLKNCVQITNTIDRIVADNSFPCFTYQEMDTIYGADRLNPELVIPIQP